MTMRVDSIFSQSLGESNTDAKLEKKAVSAFLALHTAAGPLLSYKLRYIVSFGLVECTHVNRVSFSISNPVNTMFTGTS